MAVRISIIIPVYNEERCLAANAAQVIDYLDTLELSWEMILVDDGSRDRTGDIAARLAAGDSRVRRIASPVNRGKGHAVRTGMLAARGDFRLFMDADLAVPLPFVGRLIQRLEKGAAVVIGSRHLFDSAMRVPEGALRRLMGGVYRQMILQGFRLAVSDITCGLKGFSAAATEAVFSRLRIDRWGYDAELLFVAQKLGYGVEEIPVEWYHSFDSTVRVGRDSLGTALETLRIWLNYFQGRYRLR